MSDISFFQALMEKLRRRYRKMKSATDDSKLSDRMLMRLSSRNDYKMDFLFNNLDNSFSHDKDTAIKKNVSNNCNADRDYKIQDVTDQDTNV